MVCRDVLRIRLNCWSDVARLQVGNGGLNATEDLSHFSMWCIASAPLIASPDPSSAPAEILGAAFCGASPQSQAPIHMSEIWNAYPKVLGGR